MSDKQKTPSEYMLDQIVPLTSTEALITRGMYTGQVVHEDALSQLPFIPRVASRLLTDIFKANLIIEKSRQPVPDFVTGKRGVDIREPQYIYPKFMLLMKTHWLLRTIARALVGEVLAPGHDIDSRFRKKCSKCGKEFESSEVEECDFCHGKSFDDPDIEQYKKFRVLIGKEPGKPQTLVGEGRTFKEFLYSSLMYGIGLDDLYWEIGSKKEFNTEKKKIESVPGGVRVLDGTITLPVMDEYGNFTSPQYFCPVCYKATQLESRQDSYDDIRNYPPRTDPASLKCKKCGGPLTQTAYVQKVGAKIVSRFGKDEVIHSSTSRIDPEVFGLSKIIAAVKLLYIIDYMDEYNLQIYGHGHANMILGIEGVDKNKAAEIQIQIMNQLSGQTRSDVRTGETGPNLEPVLVILGMESGKSMIPIDISPNLEAMQSIDYYRLYVEKVCGLFGVTPIFVNINDPNQSASARPTIDVQNRVTRQWMDAIEEPFNDFLLPKLGITDWVLRFGKIESRDEQRDAQIKLTNAQAVKVLRDAGFEVEVDEDMTGYTVSPKPEEPSAGDTRQDELDGAPTRTTPGGESGVPILEPDVSEEGEEK